MVGRMDLGSMKWPGSNWQEMLKDALPVLQALPEHMSWTLGGGTALALHIQHRVSHDIDIFFKTVEALELLSPTINPATRGIARSWREHGHFLKLSRDDGEIDFIVGRSIMKSPSTPNWICGASVNLEKPGEILAKKVMFRGTHLTIRDMFDIAAVAALAPAELSSLDLVDYDKLRTTRDRASLLAVDWSQEVRKGIAPLEAGMKIIENGPELCIGALDKAIERAAVRPQGRENQR